MSAAAARPAGGITEEAIRRLVDRFYARARHDEWTDKPGKEALFSPEPGA